MNDIATVFQAEFARRIKSRPFIAGLIIGAAAIVLMLQLPLLLDRVTSSEVHNVVLVGKPAVTAQARALLADDYNIMAAVRTASDYKALLAQKKAGQAIVLDDSTKGIAVTIYARDPANVQKSEITRDLLPLRISSMTSVPQKELARSMSLPVVVRSTGTRFNTSASAEAAHTVVLLMLIALYIVTLINSQLVMSSVAEEKTSRIAEMLVAAINPSSLLIGKILASTALAFLQLAVWIGIGALEGTLTTQAAPASVQASHGAPALDLTAALSVITPTLVILFVVLFVIALFQLTTMFAGVASMINRAEDIGSLSGPLVIPVVLGFIAAIAALEVPDAKWAVICSFIPMVSPFVLFARIAVSNVPAIQIALALTVNIVALVATALAVGKVYRVGMLLYGRSPSFAQIWRALRS
jgi:ABC-2 type transport system permease protein